MPHMTFDWLTVRILRPMLVAHGVRLSDLATSLHHAAAGRFSPVLGLGPGRAVGLSEFKTGHRRPGDHLVQLSGAGYDPFASPSAHTPFPALPEMWGGVETEGGERRLRMHGIALHDDLVALPCAGGGKMLVRGAMPEIVEARMAGMAFRDLVSHPALDDISLIVRRLRAATDEFERCGSPAGPGMLATFRNDKTALRLEYRI